MGRFAYDSISQALGSAGHWAQVEIEPWVNGPVLPGAQLMPEFMILSGTLEEHLPADARIVLCVDDSRREWGGRLPKGIRNASYEVLMAPNS